MTAKWIQVYLQYENYEWIITKESIPLEKTDKNNILATENELALTPLIDNKYLTGLKNNHFDLEGYTIVSKDEFFEIQQSKNLRMQAFIENGVIKPLKLINKVIIKWKN